MITPEAGVLIAQRYELVRALASGGMGSVWIARHRELDIEVTVKFMAPSLVASADARNRFEREAKAAARLGSQHVVQVMDYGVESDTPYIVMELLKGESLGTRLTRAGRIPLPEAARLVLQLCKALRTAHEAGVVHRDLKPGNIFVALKDEDEVIKVLDFGIAKASTTEAGANTESGIMLGSVHYMSPEQIRSSRTVDHRSDLWSVGVILFRALTGRLPFPGKELGDVIVRVCTDPIPAPSSIAPDLPAVLDAFFVRALARDPDQRFQSARDLAGTFSALTMGAPAVPTSSDASPPIRGAQAWRKTLPMTPLALHPSEPGAPAGATVEEVKSDLPTPEIATPSQPAPEGRQRLPFVRREQAPSAADAPTFAVMPARESLTEPTAAALVSDRRVDLSSPAPSARPRVGPSWPVWATVMAVLVGGLIAGVAFWPAASPSSAPAVTFAATGIPTGTPASAEPAPPLPREPAASPALDAGVTPPVRSSAPVTPPAPSASTIAPLPPRAAPRPSAPPVDKLKGIMP